MFYFIFGLLWHLVRLWERPLEVIITSYDYLLLLEIYPPLILSI